jgi:hypothetical protein
MDREEFNQNSFGSRTRVVYEGAVYDVGGVDFPEALIAIVVDKYSSPVQLRWIRCESCEIVTDQSMSEVE